MAHKRGRKPWQLAPREKDESVLPEEEIETNQDLPDDQETPPVANPILSPGIQDRMLPPRRVVFCPKCTASPVVCMMRQPGYGAYRCRECGHKWEVR